MGKHRNRGAQDKAAHPSFPPTKKTNHTAFGGTPLRQTFWQKQPAKQPGRPPFRPGQKQQPLFRQAQQPVFRQAQQPSKLPVSRQTQQPVRPALRAGQKQPHKQSVFRQAQQPGGQFRIVNKPSTLRPSFRPGQKPFKPAPLQRPAKQPARPPVRHGQQQAPRLPVFQPAKVAQPRQRLGTTRLIGKVASWKGKFGWIQPDVPVKHKEAQKNKGKIYLSQEDVEQEIEVGGDVSFFLYANGSGLGAMHVIPRKGSKGQASLDQGNGNKQGDSRERQQKPKLGKMALKAQKAKAQRQDGPEKEKGPSGPDLPREVLDEVGIVLGTVIAWKGKFGWIKPSEPIEVPEAKKHSGKVYVHKQDLIDAESLDKGASVQFSVFKDASGLGAQEVVVM